MSDESRVRFESKISIGNLLSIATMLAIGFSAFFAVREGGSVLAQRVDKVERQIEKGEAKDEETSRTLNDVRGAIIELRSDQKAQGRQLERIEKLIEQQNRERRQVP